MDSDEEEHWARFRPLVKPYRRGSTLMTMICFFTLHSPLRMRAGVHPLYQHPHPSSPHYNPPINQETSADLFSTGQAEDGWLEINYSSFKSESGRGEKNLYNPLKKSLSQEFFRISASPRPFGLAATVLVDEPKELSFQRIQMEGAY